MARNAGAKPKSKQVSMETPTMKPNTRRSSCNPTNRELPRVVRNATSARLNPWANSAPSAAPNRANSMLSDSSCAISLPRDAPIACRTAISRSRTLARASSRFARFAHAMSNTSPVVANSIHNGFS